MRAVVEEIPSDQIRAGAADQLLEELKHQVRIGDSPREVLRDVLPTVLALFGCHRVLVGCPKKGRRTDGVLRFLYVRENYLALPADTTVVDLDSFQLKVVKSLQAGNRYYFAGEGGEPLPSSSAYVQAFGAKAILYGGVKDDNGLLRGVVGLHYCEPGTAARACPETFVQVLDLLDGVIKAFIAQDDWEIWVEQANQLMEATPFAVGICVLETGVLLRANRRLRELLGPSADSEGFDVLSRLRWHCDFASALAGSTAPVEAKALLELDSGELAPVNLTLSRLIRAGRACVRIRVEDLRQYYVSHLPESLKGREHREAVQAAVLGEVSHELSSKLSSGLEELSSVVDAVRGEEGTMSVPHSRQLLDTAQSLLARMMDIKPLTSERERLDLVPFLRQTWPAFRFEWARVATLNLQLPSQPLWIDVSRHGLERALRNLLRNAIYADPGGRVSVGARSTGSEVELWVEDGGGGIAAEQLPRIFEPFFTTKGEQRGTGLGLSQVRLFMAEVGGEVSVSSAPSEGARFVLTFPQGD